MLKQFKLNYTLTLMSILVLIPISIFADTCDSITAKKRPCLVKEQIFESKCGLRSIFLPRSPGSNTARWLSGWVETIPGCDDRVWGNIYVAVEYAHSTKSEKLAQYLFGNTCLHFKGSKVPNRGKRDLLADNFGLPTNFIGKLCLEPTIDNIITELKFHIGLDEWFYGLYFKAYFPIVTTRWDIGAHCNEINNIGRNDVPTFPRCYMSSRVNPALTSIRAALAGKHAVFGNQKQPLDFGRFACDHLSKTGISDIYTILGLNYIQSDWAHVGPYIITVIPTSNKPEATYIFEPIFGNGGLWELGAGLSAHTYIFKYGYHSAAIWFDGYVTHQFDKFHVRSFDIAGHGPLSRYMLLKEFKADNTYAHNLINAIDFTTRAARVGNSTKIDASVKLAYYYDRWGLDIGYNLYFKSRESLCINDTLYPSDLNHRRFGIKGTEGVCFRIFDKKTGTDTGKERELNSTQSNATIFHAGTVDNPKDITNLPPDTVAITWDSSTNPNNLKIAHKSKPPVILKVDELNKRSGAVLTQMTNKVFAHLYYIALDKCWEPQIGIGGEVEFDAKHKIISSLNQWGIWIKAAFSY